MMENVRVHVGVMDSGRTDYVAVLPYASLSAANRLWKGLSRVAMISLLGLAVVLVPLLHLCGSAAALLGGPVVAVFA